MCALQQISSRMVAPHQEVVVTVGEFHAGKGRNLIPSQATLSGTVRTRDPKVRKKVLMAIEEMAQQMARGFLAKASVTFLPGCGRVKNDPTLMVLVRQVGEKLLGKGNVP